jgi:hypothetical protein
MSNLVVFTSPTLDGSCTRRASPTRTRCWDRDAVFADGGPLATLRLLDTKPATTGMPVASYQPTRTDGGHGH